MPFRVLLALSILTAGSLPTFGGTPVEGLVQPIRQAEVGAPVSGRILELKVAEGEVVKEGQPIALLYGKLEELEMMRAKALLERREYEAKGAKRLYDNRIIPEAKALESRIELDLARLQYETAAEQVRLRTVLAPLSGVVVARLRETGEAVSTAQPLFRILDLSRVAVTCAVEPRALTGLAAGQKAQVHLPQMPEAGVLEGEIALVDPFADAAGLVRVKVVVANPDQRIRAGLRALVDLPSPK